MKVFSVYLFSLIVLTPNLTQATLTLVPTPPSISADAYLLEDFHSQQTLMEKNADKQIKPASLTKLMTAYLVFEELRAHNIQLTDRVKISEKAWRMPGSRMYLEVDTTVPVEQLLKGMIIQSGNDASIALAEFVAGSEEAFVDLMNNRAQSLGLNH
ncbi:MAG: serine hydrolase, partial [Pseudomonadota bacterium]|nr:serine hydrolase [Pseudomonadota bacterium]